jgi:hypothetical protein
MLGFKIKRGVEASVERIFKATGSEFDKLTFNWSGKTAAVSFSKTCGVVTARVIFPNIDDNKQIPDSVHHDLVGYAVHELGHIWFTDNDPWDAARHTHGAFVGSLINGLEDPRIERFVIESGHVPNARVLFNHVLNSVLLKGGYVEPDDFKNIPFMLAIEGRRLNGYNIPFPSILPDSPWREDLEWALAQPARDTFDVTVTAIELNRRLQKKKKSKSRERSKTDSRTGRRSRTGRESRRSRRSRSKEKQGKQGKQKKQKESKAIELGDALSDQLSDCTQNSSIPMTEKITFETFEWEQS